MKNVVRRTTHLLYPVKRNGPNFNLIEEPRVVVISCLTVSLQGFRYRSMKMKIRVMKDEEGIGRKRV